MKFFDLTLLRKYITLSVVMTGVLCGVLLVLRSLEIITFVLLPFFIAFGVFFVLSVFLFWHSISRPLFLILRQMEALLSGRPYKKIYTDRVDEVGVLAHFFNEVTKHLSSFTGEIQQGERMKEELSTAAAIQRSILPSTTPVLPGLLVSANTRPAAEVGGDSFDFVTTGDRTIFYVGDVTGHGVPAGLIMTMVNMLVYTYGEIYPNIYDLMVSLNRQLKRRIQNARYMTMVMMQWNHVEKKLSYVGAGHEHILVFRSKTGMVEVIKTGGIALGMVPDASKLIQEIPLSLEENDMVLLYTDGITEARNMTGGMFGLERLQESFLRYAAQYNPDGVSQHIVDDLQHFAEGCLPGDDITLIVLKRAEK
ncbi:MAG: SpoIIE family protein phosphatase [Patescibacteria group bacterium]